MQTLFKIVPPELSGSGFKTRVFHILYSVRWRASYAGIACLIRLASVPLSVKLRLSNRRGQGLGSWFLGEQ